MSKTSPRHYQMDNGFQVIDLTSQLDFCSGNVVKYVARAGKKSGESVLDDLRKAEYYLRRLINDAESTRKTDSPAARLQPAGNAFSVDAYLRNQGS
tara:strand:+ start:351 stop:638 length:288 start_codon:yes stop_codon:yes gene_type:complete